MCSKGQESIRSQTFTLNEPDVRYQCVLPEKRMLSSASGLKQGMQCLQMFDPCLSNN